MESICHRCGDVIEGQPSFCPSCGAPQIRVSVPQSQVSDRQEPAPPPPPPSPLLSVPVVLTGQIDWRTFLRIALPLAVGVGFLTRYSPLLGWLFLLPGSVILSVYVYRRRQPGPLRTAQGIKMGVVIALLAFVVLAAILGAQIAYDPAAYRQQMETQMREALARNPNPEAQQMVQTLFGGAGGIVLLTAMMMAFLLVFLLVIGAVSGALAASLARDKPKP